MSVLAKPKQTWKEWVPPSWPCICYAQSTRPLPLWWMAVIDNLSWEIKFLLGALQNNQAPAAGSQV
jgi:hypothetical protein